MNMKGWISIKCFLSIHGKAKKYHGIFQQIPP